MSEQDDLLKSIVAFRNEGFSLRQIAELVKSRRPGISHTAVRRMLATLSLEGKSPDPEDFFDIATLKDETAERTKLKLRMKGNQIEEVGKWSPSDIDPKALAIKSRLEAQVFEKRGFLAAMIDAIARETEFTPTEIACTHWYFLHSCVEYMAAFRAARQWMIDAAEKTIYKAIVDGDVAAAQWLLKLQAVDRGYGDKGLVVQHKFDKPPEPEPKADEMPTVIIKDMTKGETKTVELR